VLLLLPIEARASLGGMCCSSSRTDKPTFYTHFAFRFIKVGPATVQKVDSLNKKIRKNMETDDGETSVFDWTKIPGWCVVTTKLSPDEPEVEMEDFKSTSCAIQNFMLSMWSEGIGTTWTSGPVQRTNEFAEICGVDSQKERVVGKYLCFYSTMPYGFDSCLTF
jgi:hypothetical protein